MAGVRDAELYRRRSGSVTDARNGRLALATRRSSGSPMWGHVPLPRLLGVFDCQIRSAERQNDAGSVSAMGGKGRLRENGVGGVWDARVTPPALSGRSSAASVSGFAFSCLVWSDFWRGNVTSWV